MKSKCTYLVLLSMFCYAQVLFAQSEGDYRTTNSGNWADASTWQRFTGGSWVAAPAAPSATDGVITILNTHTVTVTATASADQLVIASGGILTINAAFTITDGTGTDLDVLAGGTLNSGGQINGTGSLTVRGTMNWTANPISVPLTIATGAILHVTGTAGTDRVYETTLTNNGTVNWNLNADLVLSIGTVINNGDFTWNSAASRQLRSAAGIQTFINAGTFTKLNLGTTLSIPSVAFTNNSGAILRGQGTISFDAPGTITNNGTIAPESADNNSASVLNISSSAISPNSSIAINIVSSLDSRSGGHDQLNFLGLPDLAGTTLTITDNPAAPLGTYFIMTATSSFRNNFGTVNKPPNFSDPVVVGTIVTIQKLSVLPLTWGTFSAKAVEQRALLTWQTLQEFNTSHFVIERSTDGVNYRAIGNLPAQGNSTVTHTYTFTDPSPVQKSLNFYRILQVDIDGKSAHSIVRIVRLDHSELVSLIIQGNPVKNNVLNLNVTADHALNITISDMNGRVMKAKLLQPGNHVLPISELNAGTYQITVMENGTITAIKRFVKL